MIDKPQDKPQVSRLAVRRGKPPDGDWHATVGSNDKLYSYRFLGGRKGRGHLNAIVDGRERNYLVRLRNEDCVIEDVTFKSDAGQLHLVNKGECGREAQIHNANTRVIQAYYNVVVRGPNDELIDCDPMISNDPRSRS